MEALNRWTIQDLYHGVREQEAMPSKEDTIRLVGELKTHWFSGPSCPMEIGVWMFMLFGAKYTSFCSVQVERAAAGEEFRCARLKRFCTHHDLDDENSIVHHIQKHVRRMAVVMHQMLIVHSSVSHEPIQASWIREYEAIEDLLKLKD